MPTITLATEPARAARPEAVPYQEGDESPRGYHLEQRARTGPLVAGGILFGVAYTVAVVTIISPETSRWVLVPLVGPFIAEPRSPGSWHRFDDLDRGGQLLINGVVQSTGVVAIVCGLALQRTWWVRDESTVTWQLAPMATRGTAGLTLRGLF